MTEAQIWTLALANLPTVVVVLIGILLNNSRLNDVKELLRAEIHTVDARVTGMREIVQSQLDLSRAEMEKNHSEMLHRFGDLDSRLTRIENSLGIARS